jgi:hypothetical protein
VKMGCAGVECASFFFGIVWVWFGDSWIDGVLSGGL